jgi:DNA polymerase-3 subunit alpha
MRSRCAQSFDRLRGGSHQHRGFCRRVDLRIVNRRALEALMKVGAFEDFGNRAQLLQLIDRMLGMSNSSHRAEEAGQMSLFGAMDGGVTSAMDTIGALPKPKAS